MNDESSRNVRELMAVIERAAILGDGKRLEVGKALGTIENGVAIARERPPTQPPPPVAAAMPAPAIGSLDDAMAAHIERALHATRGRIEGPFGAAKLLGINPHTLRARMRKLRIDWSRYRSQSDAEH